MQKNNNFIKIYFSISIIFLIGFIISTYCLIDIKNELDKTNNDIIFMSIMKIVPPLSGAFLSGLVALFIFSLTKRKEKETKEKDSSAALEIINFELNENLESIKKIMDILNAGNSNILADMILDSEDPTKEKLSLLEPQLTIKIIDESVKKLSFDDFITIATKLKYLNLIKNSFEILINKLSSKEALEKSIDTLKHYCSEYENLIALQGTTHKKKKDKFKDCMNKLLKHDNFEFAYNRFKLTEVIFFLLVIIIIIVFSH